MESTTVRGNPILNWIISGKFEKFYTRKVRLAAHASMWLIILILQTILVYVNYNESLSACLAFGLRNMLSIMFFFYFILYFVVPDLILKGRFILGILCLTIPFFVNSLFNYIACVFIQHNLVIQDPVTKKSIETIVNDGVFSVSLLHRTLKGAWFFASAAAPSAVLKLVLDIIRGTIRQLNMERDKVDLELDFLKAQLNPHFLFNTLNNIYTLSLKGDQQASGLILHLSSMMRYTLYESDTPVVLLQNEVDFMRNYTELERVRYGKKANIRFECNEEEIDNQQIGPLLMFPFVENAFKYGQCNAAGKCEILIKIQADGPFVQIEIGNSKNEATMAKSDVGGIGQSNSRKRLELLYPGRHTLNIEDTPDYYKVILSLTLANYNQNGTKN